MSTRREFLTQTAMTALMARAATSLTDAHAQEAKSTATPPVKPAGAMKTYQLPHTDLVVSRLVYGCAMIGFDWDSPDFVARTVATINAAYQQGINLFDTADVYGHGKAETALGEVLKASPGLRNKIVIQSKCGTVAGGAIDNSSEHILGAVNGSLARLGTDHLDILLIHWPDSLVEPEEVARAFDELQRAGKVRYFGVSNHSPWQIELLQKTVRQPLAINQIQLGLAHWYTQAGPAKGAVTHGEEGVATLDYCHVHDIHVQAYSPLKAGNIRQPPNLLNPASDATAEVRKATQTLLEVANAHGTTPAAVMLAWLLHHPAHIAPIIGATKVEHVVENCAADRVELTRAEWYSLLRTVSEIEPRTAA